MTAHGRPQIRNQQSNREGRPDIHSSHQVSADFEPLVESSSFLLHFLHVVFRRTKGTAPLTMNDMQYCPLFARHPRGGRSLTEN